MPVYNICHGARGIALTRCIRGLEIRASDRRKYCKERTQRKAWKVCGAMCAAMRSARARLRATQRHFPCVRYTLRLTVCRPRSWWRHYFPVTVTSNRLYSLSEQGAVCASVWCGLIDTARKTIPIQSRRAVSAFLTRMHAGCICVRPRLVRNASLFLGVAAMLEILSLERISRGSRACLRPSTVPPTLSACARRALRARDSRNLVNLWTR